MVGIIFGNTSKNDKHNLGTTIYMFYKHKSYHSQSYIQLLSTLDTHFWSVENSLLWHFHPSPPPPPPTIVPKIPIFDSPLSTTYLNTGTVKVSI